MNLASALSSATILHVQAVPIYSPTLALRVETCRQTLILRASHLTLATHSQAKGRAAVTDLRADAEAHSTNPDTCIDFSILNLADYDSEFRFIQKVKANLLELHIALCHADINHFHYRRSKSGYKKIMQGMPRVLA
ncbi:carbonyl reductase [Penicillium macrosclerotiorum]|uniref:carbonyl reductase n=1 Tax=Penicillium macrosclerotiorum TaxID=303699 RepID=UPI002549840D|nr:carbonyl reductase [Penicillium macrosclerotiorum]KAJ5669473.1 carbonyl reductase [Penicillium macrosclerotiorum]